MKNDIAVLIVAQPGRMRNSLRTLVMSMPRVTCVKEIDDGPSALRAIWQSNPSLILLDTNIPDEQTWTVLSQTKTNYPQTKCIVLAGNTQQQRTAKAAGADNALLKGFPAEKLFAAIESLLTKPGELINEIN